MGSMTKTPKGGGGVKKSSRLRKNDTVMIMSGKDRGKTGRLLRLDREKGRAYIQGLNMVKKAVKPKSQNDKGGITEVEASLDLSNLRIVNKEGKPDRIGYRFEDGSKVRFCKKSGETL